MMQIDAQSERGAHAHGNGCCTERLLDVRSPGVERAQLTTATVRFGVFENSVMQGTRGHRKRKGYCSADDSGAQGRWLLTISLSVEWQADL